MAANIKTIELALQGGGAHGALTWGVLERLLEEPALQIEGISGTSAGAMNAVVLADGLEKGGRDAARAVASGCRLFAPATSLGGVESLIEHRATVEGPLSLVPANLLRLSVGIEDADDLIDDLEQALKRI